MLMSISEVILPLRARAHVFYLLCLKTSSENTRNHKTCEAEEILPLFLATTRTFPASVDGNRAFEGQILTFIPPKSKKLIAVLIWERNLKMRRSKFWERTLKLLTLKSYNFQICLRRDPVSGVVAVKISDQMQAKCG